MSSFKIVGHSLFRYLSSLVPPNNHRIYQWCKHYVDSYNGENNDDIKTNGELRLMQGSLPKCETVFDVGANTGVWAELALEINPDSTIHCFEPSQMTFRKLSANQFPKNVVINNFGFSSSAHDAHLYVFDDGAGINSLYQRQGLEGFGLSMPTRKEPVHLETLDHYCVTRDIVSVDFLKIDVEGHELDVFMGARQMLESQRVNLIQFEYGGCNIDAKVLLKDIFDFFKPLNYSFHKIFPNELRPAPAYDQRYENFQYQNWAIVRNGSDFIV